MCISVFDSLREWGARRRVHLVGHIADTPQIIPWKGRKYMVFHLRELPATVLHVKMLPTTPRRHKGDRVELTIRLTNDATAFAESVWASADLEVIRQAEIGGPHRHS